MLMTLSVPWLETEGNLRCGCPGTVSSKAENKHKTTDNKSRPEVPVDRRWTLLLYAAFGMIWASTRENLSSGVCEQHRCRPACASAQTDQRLIIRFLENIISQLAKSEILFF